MRTPEHPLRFLAGGSWLTGTGSSWSRRGVFVHSAQIFPPGTRVTVVLTPPGERRPLILHGRVEWARTAGVSGMGVVFCDVPDATATHLERLAPRSPKRLRRNRGSA